MADQTELLNRVADAPSISDYLAQTSAAADAAGFTAANSLTVLSRCRDKLCQHVTGKVEELRGQSFDASGLAGVPALGSVGWGAALAQCPEPADPRLVMYVFTHIGIGTSPEGTQQVGLVRTVDGHPPRAVCGALAGAHRVIASSPYGAAKSPTGHDDPEFARVCALLAGVPHEDFGEFTFAASPLVAEYALRDLQKVAADQPRPPIVALFAALQIHTDGEDRAIPIAQHLG